jgi:hypothetical protein
LYPTGGKVKISRFPLWLVVWINHDSPHHKKAHAPKRGAKSTHRMGGRRHGENGCERYVVAFHTGRCGDRSRSKLIKSFFASQD